MQQIIKHYCWIALLAAGLQTSWGFALLGPLTLANGADNWQTPVIGYDYGYADEGLPGGLVFLGDIGGPRNIAEEYRRNVPVIYYTYDQTFLNFFGSNGVAAVDSSYAIINAVMTNSVANGLDGYSPNLSEFPLQAMHFNYTAQSDFLTDIKSVTLHLLVEQLGLADPERFVWTLHDRVLPPGGKCPVDEEYLVVQRNLDYLTSSANQIQYSSYINDVLYSYIIEEICAPGNPLAWTVPFSTDPEAEVYTSVAANNFDGYGLGYLNNNGTQPVSTSGGLQIGAFYTGLTRDDVAGLKYLFTTNNVNLELPDPTSLLFTVTTNYSLQQLFPNGTGTNIIGTNGLGFYVFDGTYGYGDYGWLVATSQTNSPAQMQALYPGLAIASSYDYFVMSSNATYAQYFTNSGYGSVYPPVLTLVTVTNYTPFLLQKYATVFANVFTNHFYTNTTSYLQTITVVPNTGAPYPSLKTNSTTVPVVNNIPSGDFFLLTMFHSNACPLDFLYTGLTNVVAITNFLTGASTNIVTATNTSTYTSTMLQINYFTNYIWVTHPVNCAEVTNAANLYQGIGGTTFVRADYDSLISQYFRPITNYYSMVALTNSQWVQQKFVRVVTQPDILMDAQDEGLPNTFNGTVLRNINFTPSPILNGLAGPGTIDTPSTFTYNKIGDAFWNGASYEALIYNDLSFASSNAFLGQYFNIPSVAWASFDASTNEPVLYPSGTSIQNLENQLAVRLSPSSPPDGTNGSYYVVSFSATGGAFVPPFTWSASGIPGDISGVTIPGVGIGLPPGMNVLPDGTLYGTPTSSGVYDFILQLSDSSPSPRTVQWTLSINIH